MNPLLTKSPLPYSLPQFDKIKTEHFIEAIEKGIKEHKKELENIILNKRVPTFKNTILALEKSGELLYRAVQVLWNLTEINHTSEIEKIVGTFSPIISEHDDNMIFNIKLFEKIKYVYNKRKKLKLSAEEFKLLEETYESFVNEGAELNENKKQKLLEINKQLSTLTNQFGFNVSSNEKANAIVVYSKYNLKGIKSEVINTLKENAKNSGLSKKYLIKLENTSAQNIIKSIESRILRCNIFNNSVNRAQNVETIDLVLKILKLRQEKAEILGHQNYASFAMKDAVAKNPANVLNLLRPIAEKISTNIKTKTQELQDFINSLNHEITLKAWDWHYYSSLLKQKTYDFNDRDVEEYFEVNSVLENGVLFAASQLYGLTFKERKDLPVYHPDVRIFEVFDHNGEGLGLCLFDWFKRDSKCSGAWMNNFVSQSKFLKTKPVIVNALNIQKTEEKTLMSFTEVTTAFHEFGHGLHGLLSNVQFKTLSGTNVPRDFVEYPSILNEMWATNKTVLKNYAKHYKTGKVVSNELIKKMKDAANFDQAYNTAEYLMAALLDIALHQLSLYFPDTNNLELFENSTLKGLGFDTELIPPRYKTNYFSHIFSHPTGYAAGYYSYLWCEIMVKNTEKWFNDNGGLTRENGEKFRKAILSQGNTQNLAEMFEKFNGGPPDVTPLLESRGLV